MESSVGAASDSNSRGPRCPLLSSADARFADRDVRHRKVNTRERAATSGYSAHDADDGFTEPRGDGRWGWRSDKVAELLSRASNQLLFFAGCSDEQIHLPFDYRVLLTAPQSTLVERLRTRTTNSYGRDSHELSQVLEDLVNVEPLLRRSADLVLTTNVPPGRVADLLLQYLAEQRPGII